MKLVLGSLLSALTWATFPTAALAQSVFVRNTADVPTSTGATENVDFGDIDNDGDWDAVFADGGDFGSQQNKIWTNNAGLQGGAIGLFTNVTAAQAPAVSDTSRDIEFVDFDADGDLDIHVSNDCQVTPSKNGARWWTNMGGLQGGSIGFYQDQTVARWVGLGTFPSSVAPSLVLVDGGFMDFSPDGDFGDVDNDGDLDLIHASYGGAFSGNIPTRIFLNDGAGFFSEFNPSGFQLPGQNIANGDPGLWCEGTQQQNTVDATGAFCDIATSGLNLDLGDIDGDLDLDIIRGARQEVPRMYGNRLEENGGLVLGFRDVTGAAYPPGYASGSGHYEEEFGDFDADNDLDIIGVNWLITGFMFNDVTLTNNGSGIYGNLAVIPGSGSDDNDAEFVDYDNDGDLDLFLVNFSGQDRLYENNGSGSYNTTTGTVPTDTTTSLDADGADVDADGDSDLFVANDANQAEWYLQNITGIADVSAPRLARLEQAPNRAASAVPTVVRVQVYDNAAYYTTWYNATVLEYTVNGGATQSVPMQSSQGQIFRGEIPGGLVGTINYRAVSTDEHNNTGNTPSLSYVATAPSALGTPYCFGDGSVATPCPCGNLGLVGSGCQNSAGTGGAQLTASGQVDPDTVTLRATALLASVPGVFLQGDADIPAGVVFGDGVRCAGGTLKRLALKMAVGGVIEFPGVDDPSISARSYALGDLLSPGDVRFYQAYYRDPNLGFCAAPPGNSWNVSNGLILTW